MENYSSAGKSSAFRWLRIFSRGAPKCCHVHRYRAGGVVTAVGTSLNSTMFLEIGRRLLLVYRIPSTLGRSRTRSAMKRVTTHSLGAWSHSFRGSLRFKPASKRPCEILSPRIFIPTSRRRRERRNSRPAIQTSPYDSPRISAAAVSGLSAA